MWSRELREGLCGEVTGGDRADLVHLVLDGAVCALQPLEDELKAPPDFACVRVPRHRADLLERAWLVLLSHVRVSQRSCVTGVGYLAGRVDSDTPSPP